MRLLRFLVRERMLTPKYARLLLRYLRRRFLTLAGWRWRTSGMVFLGRRLSLQIGRRGQIRFGRFVWIGDGTKIRCHEGEVIIDAKTVLGQECTVSAYRHVRIGEQCPRLPAPLGIPGVRFASHRRHFRQHGLAAPC